MSVVRDTDARWRASVPTARRGRKHARARVLPGKALTADCGAGVLGWVHDWLKVINVILRGFWAKFSAGTPDGADTGRNGREAALDMTTPHPQSLSPLRGEGSQGRPDRQLGRFGCERNML